MKVEDEVYLIIQRVRDERILCSREMTDEGEPLFAGWFLSAHVPDEYGFVVFNERAMRDKGYHDDESLTRIAPTVVAECIGEFYEVGELEFLRFLPEASEFPTRLQ